MRCVDINLFVANCELGSDVLVGCLAVRPFEIPENTALYLDEAFRAGEEPSRASLEERFVQDSRACYVFVLE